MFDGKAGDAPPCDAAFDGDVIAERGRCGEHGAGLDHGDAGNSVCFEKLSHGQTGFFEEVVGTRIEKLEITRIIDDAERVAIAPFDMDGFLIDEQ